MRRKGQTEKGTVLRCLVSYWEGARAVCFLLILT